MYSEPPPNGTPPPVTPPPAYPPFQPPQAYPPFQPPQAYPPFQPPQAYPPPYYQQPYPGPMPPPPSVVGDNGAVIAGLGYLIFLVGLIMFFAEQHNRFVKFHAAQSILIHLAAIASSVIWTLLFIVATVVGVGAGAASNSSSGVAASLVGILILILILLAITLTVLYIAALIWGMVAAFSGRATKLPVVGGLAERWSGGPLPIGPVR